MCERAIPCRTCPYRRAVELIGYWDITEYRKLAASLAIDPDSFPGFVFHCHTHGRKTDHPHRLCTGWLIEHRTRARQGIKLPIALIMRLCADPAAARQYETASSGGVELL